MSYGNVAKGMTGVGETLLECLEGYLGRAK